MIEVITVLILGAGMWTIFAGVFSFRVTKRFAAGLFLSVVIASLPFLVLIAYNGFTARIASMLGTYLAFSLPIILIIGALFWLDRRDRRLTDPVHCSTCGYDLTGNVSGVCPECGAVIEDGEMRF